MGFSNVLLLVATVALLGTGVHAGLFSRNSLDQQITLHSSNTQPQAQQQPSDLLYRSSLDRSRIQYQTNRNEAVDASAGSGGSKHSPMGNGQSAPIPFMRSGGFSAWGIIGMIVFVFLVGMIGYYGIMCYPLLCTAESSYNTMGEASSTSSGTPMHKIADFDDFEGKRNYSSRSTTPSKSHE